MSYDSHSMSSKIPVFETSYTSAISQKSWQGKCGRRKTTTKRRQVRSSEWKRQRQNYLAVLTVTDASHVFQYSFFQASSLACDQGLDMYGETETEGRKGYVDRPTGNIRRPQPATKNHNIKVTTQRITTTPSAQYRNPLSFPHARPTQNPTAAQHGTALSLPEIPTRRRWSPRGR